MLDAKSKASQKQPIQAWNSSTKKDSASPESKHLSLCSQLDIYETIQVQQQVLPDSWFSVRRYLLKGKSSISDGFTKVGFGLSK